MVRGSGEPIFPASSAGQRLRTLRLHHLHRPSGGTDFGSFQEMAGILIFASGAVIYLRRRA
ncbi:MAG: hypothetical protein AVDCRST_MAG93-2297 [uncultured Chloroflexia bacterium]|uniref:Uncharacterized protein n=1 Tax=uncultured Chloroflexia bacterium TaxID=1672391 RepID=A0A6J4IVW9_9CHLR|nr:MAG: hypothetical protein AVDCRST_MAG93-2297 [uncultured Chloroflexia bacterium]